jgi:hypothetical protein
MADEFIDGGDPFDPEHISRREAAPRKVLEDVADATRRLLLRRKEAYTRVFEGNPMGDDIKIVMEDLARFCRADETTFDANDRVHALLTGRQEVMMRIRDHMRLGFDALFDKYATPRG